MIFVALQTEVSKRFFFTERGQFAINLKKMQANPRRVSEFVF